MNLDFDKSILHTRLTASGVVALYAVFSALWIIISRLLLRSHIDFGNDLVLVAASSMLLFLLLRGAIL